jgi:hypothetical protein
VIASTKSVSSPSLTFQASFWASLNDRSALERDRGGSGCTREVKRGVG